MPRHVRPRRLRPRRAKPCRARGRAPLSPALPPPPIFPPSERPPRSGALATTETAHREGGSLSAATRVRGQSVFRSGDRGNCCAPYGSRQSGSNRTTASLGSPPPGRRGEQYRQSRSGRNETPRGICTCRAEGLRPASAASACSCSPCKTKAPRPHDGDHGAHAIRLSPRLQNKSAKQSAVYTVKSFGAGASSEALALAHIHDRFPAAQLAVQREVCQRCRRPHALLRRASA